MQYYLRILEIVTADQHFRVNVLQAFGYICGHSGDEPSEIETNFIDGTQCQSTHYRYQR